MSLRHRLVLSCALLLASGCSSSPNQFGVSVNLESFVINDGTPESRKPIRLEMSQLREQVVDALEKNGVSHKKTETGNHWRLRLRVDLVYGVRVDDGLAATVQSGTAAVLVRSELSLSAPGSDASMHQFFERRFEADEPGETTALRRQLRELASKSMVAQTQWVVGRLRLLVKSESELLPVLNDPAVENRLAAIERLAMMRSKGAVIAMLEALEKENDLRVKQRLIGAFAEIGDPRAARALIDLADTRDHDMLRAIVNTLSVIGGDNVMDFFELLSMHDAPAVRAIVGEGRRRLERTSNAQKRQQGQRP
ncbi:MAG: HEAT repeat domain-containing protein [Bradymonadia bacterium]